MTRPVHPARTPQTAAVAPPAAGPAGTGVHPRASVPVLNLTPARRAAAAAVHAMADPPILTARWAGSWHWVCLCGAWAVHRRRDVVARTAYAHHYAERPIRPPTEATP
jgi:hypothetical protein